MTRYNFMGRFRTPIHFDGSETFPAEDAETQTRDTPSLKSRQIQLTLRSRSDILKHSLVLDELSFATLRPKPVLQTFTETLFKTKVVSSTSARDLKPN